MITQDQLKDRHKTGFKGIYTAYIQKKICRSKGFAFSFVMSFVCFVFLSFYSDSNYYELLSKVVNLNVSVFPDLLGFCIGGYALIIGFGHKEMLEKMSSPLSDKENNMSYFQITSSVFAISVIIQIVAFFTSYITSHIIYIGFYSSNITLCKYINIFVITLIFFLSSYSILLLYYMVINIFTFGQMMHFCIRKEKLDEDIIKNSKTNSKTKKNNSTTS